jgi:pseudaminic acid cytidylyltransferase
MNVAIIPARGGSRRVPRKNVRDFHGRPIIAYSIEAAKASGLFERVIVSTDDKEIAEVSRFFGAAVFPREWDNGDRGTQEVTAEVLRWTGDVDRACCIYATAPMLLPGDLCMGLASLREHPYAYVPGLYYWGRTDAFLSGVPLSEGVEVQFPAGRYIDINTPEDFEKAERMYAELHRIAA